MEGYRGVQGEGDALKILTQAAKRVENDLSRYEILMRDLHENRRAYLKVVSDLLELHAQHEKVQTEIGDLQERVSKERRPQIGTLPRLQASNLAITMDDIRAKADEKGINLARALHDHP